MDPAQKQLRADYPGLVPDAMTTAIRPAQWPVAGSGRMLWGAAVIVAIAFAVLNRIWLSAVDPWIVVTAPLNSPHETNSIIGYSWLLDGAPVHKENLSPLRQSLSFNGALTYPDGYFLRPVYPFVVSLGSWLFGLGATALAVNCLSVGVLVVTTAWFATQMEGRRGTAVLAGLLASVGTGVVVHLNDLSAHLLASATYAVATALIFASEVWHRRRPFSVHLAVGMALAVSALVYPTGFLLTVGYVLVALPHSRPYYVAAAAAMGFLIRTAWEYWLNAAYRAFFGVGPFDLYTIDFGTAKQISIDYWLGLLKSQPSEIPAALLRPLTDSLFVMFPLLTIVGIVALVLVNWRKWARLWFYLVFFALPYINIVFFSPGALARGYLVYCSAFLLMASSAALAFRYVGDRTVTSAVALSMSALCLVTQAIWSHLIYFGYVFPVLAFYVGPSNAGTRFVKPEIVNLAADAPLWRFFGGAADFTQAGGLPLGAVSTAGTTAGNSWFALALNAFLISLIVAAALLSSFLITDQNGDRGRASGSMRHLLSVAKWPALCLALLVAAAALGFAYQKQQLLPFSTEQVTRRSGEETLALRVRMSPEASGRMLDLLRGHPGLESIILLRASGLVAASLTLGNQPLDLTRYRGDEVPLMWRVDRAALQEALAAGNDVLALTVTLRDGVVGGWQTASEGTRQVMPVLAVEGRNYWPSLELRLMDRARNATVFLAY